MSKELIVRLREAAAQRVASTAMIGADDLIAAADALEKTEAARMAAISRLCEAEVACATACQERDALAAGQKQMGEDLIVIQRIHSEQKARLYGEIAMLKADIKAAREQEPVAVYKGHRHIPSDTKEFWGMADNHLPAGTHLYARPVLSRELTDKVIERLFDESAFQENEMRDAADYFAHEIERYLKGEGE